MATELQGRESDSSASCSDQLAYSDCNGTERDQSQHWAGGRAEYGIEELADSRQQPTGAEGRGLDGGWEDAGAEARVGATERNGFADGDNSLGDTTTEGLSEHELQPATMGRQEPQPEPVGASWRTPYTWPPRPSDTDAWERLLRERPDLAPALDKEVESQFRGVDHGRSHRVDELKALGNGLVPAVVAEFLHQTLSRDPIISP